MEDDKELATQNLIPEETIQSKIFLLRGKKVIIDKDIAQLYGVKPTALRQQVKRNAVRFPEDFMFKLTKQELISMVSQNVIPSVQSLGGHQPYAFQSRRFKAENRRDGRKV